METEEHNSQGEEAVEPKSIDEAEMSYPDGVQPQSKPKLGPMIVVGVAVLCLLVILWFLYLIWNQPAPAPQPAVEPTPTEVVEEEVEPERNEPRYVNRNVGLVGVAQHPNLGQFIVEPQTGQTLYINKAGECIDECLEVWTPYTTDEEVRTIENLGLIELSDGSYQFTWLGQPLYTYNDDTFGGALGDGYAGTWRIARP